MICYYTDNFVKLEVEVPIQGILSQITRNIDIKRAALHGDHNRNAT